MSRRRQARLPRVSVVTPALEQARYLVDALDSVLLQTVPVEHIVIDGGSRDGTVELLTSRSGVRWRSEPDEGQSDALNKGFALCDGDIVGWLNADDFYLKGAIQCVVSFFDENPDVDIVYGDCLFVDANGGVIRAKCEHGFDEPTLRLYGIYMPSTATFFRRSLVERGALFVDPSYHYVMDFELFTRLAAQGVRFGYIPEVLAAFRWHGENKSLDDAPRIAERHRAQRSTNRLQLPDAAYDVLHGVYRVRHLFLKVVSGGLGRQMAWRERRGEDMRWWRQP
jgi:glycosyltransferase involved in cell wall biosynthesis